MKENEILFRSHQAGLIMTNGKGIGITKNQEETLLKLQKKIKDGGKLTPKQMISLKELTDKKNAPFELSDTAKDTVRDLWLLNEKGFRKEIKSKYLDKGLFGEESSISLLSEVTGNFFTKNTERKTKENRSGECDIKTIIEGRKIIIDIKSSWDAKTFMESSFSKLYEWQGRDYMDLYDADEFWLCYCLVDCPEHIVAKEKEKLFYTHYSSAMTTEEQVVLEEKLEPLMNQIERNLVYSTNPLYTKEERIKIYKIKRDDALFSEYKERIKHCIDYYKTIELNDLK